MIRALAFLVVFAMTAVGCDGGGSGVDPAEREDVKKVMETLILASFTGDLDAARPHLDVGQFLLSMNAGDAFRLNELSPEEREGYTQSAFNQLLAVKDQSKIRDRASLNTALGVAEITILTQTRRATVRFQGPDAQSDSGGTVKFVADLMQTPGGVWKLMTLEPLF